MLAEPYHVVIVIGYPRGFSEESSERLRTLMSHSARAGIGVFLVCDPSIGADVSPQRGDEEAPYWTKRIVGTWGVPNRDTPSGDVTTSILVGQMVRNR